jgi:hypothetical protein
MFSPAVAMRKTPSTSVRMKLPGRLAETLLTIRWLNNRQIVSPATSKMPTIAPAPKDNIAATLSA